MSEQREEAVSGAGRQFVSMTFYSVLVVAMAMSALSQIRTILSQTREVAVLREHLADLDRRMHGSTLGGTGTSPSSAQSPFLDGDTVTVAGAALQTRIKQAVREAGGALTSSQIELEDARAGDGYIGLTADLEIAPAQLQTLAYDLEAGTPYVYFDVFDAQPVEAVSDSTSQQMHVVLSASSPWKPRK